MRLTMKSLVWCAAFLAMALPAAAASTDSASCQVLYNASDKVYTVPNHMFTTQTAQFRDNRPTAGEAIFTQNGNYILVHGRWMKSPLTSQDGLAQARENRTQAKNVSCRYLRDEVIDRQPASLYSEHFENEDAVNDGRIWISKQGGLLLRVEQDTDVGGAAGKSHRSIRYEYGNVLPPVVAH